MHEQVSDVCQAQPFLWPIQFTRKWPRVWTTFSRRSICRRRRRRETARNGTRLWRSRNKVTCCYVCYQSTEMHILKNNIWSVELGNQMQLRGCDGTGLQQSSWRTQIFLAMFNWESAIKQRPVHAVQSLRKEDLCKMLPALFTAITLSMLASCMHHELVQWRRCCCLQMKTSVFCLLLPLHFLSAYFAEMSFPPILSNLVHKGASVKWAYISPKDTIKMR